MLDASERQHIFARNLAALKQSNPDIAVAVEAATPADIAWSDAKKGGLTAAWPASGDQPAMQLASRYDPKAEAVKLVDTVDFTKAAAVVVLGFALGHHVVECLRRLNHNGARGLLIVFEPDVEVLRSVLEHIPLAAAISRGDFVLALPSTDRGQLLGKVEKFASLITQGTTLLSHPPTVGRHAEACNTFTQLTRDMTAFCRTNIATALVNSSRTCRNLSANLDLYAAGATTDDLYMAAKGYPAVCVAAGPSLVKNVHLLTDPAIREQVVVIAVQTALRPLLERGVKPDFVTALDYSPISTRFYEGLDRLDDVTLVVDPKVSCAVVDAYPGPIRTLHNEFNDSLLEDLARPIRPIPSGATVAHLSYYLAAHLGCDPILLIGQDLGFSDGLYYCPGTAVHRVWDCEMNPWNTVEMLEWTRIVRMRGHLRRVEDIHGRPIFTDEQMVTYQKHFERDFAKAKAEGKSIIDATEGGVQKEHTKVQPLAEALDAHLKGPVPALQVPEQEFDLDRLTRLEAMLTQRVSEVHDLRKTTKQTLPLLDKMKASIKKPQEFNRLHEKLTKMQRHVEHDLKRAFHAVNTLNTIGAFKRLRADRVIRQTAGSTAQDKQREQILRDQDNLRFLVEACDESLLMFDEAVVRVRASLERARDAAPAKPQPAGMDRPLAA